MDNTFIIAANHSFNINCPVILWKDINGLSFYPHNNLTQRKKNFAELQQDIRLAVIHHSVTYRAIETYNVLNTRKLSVNFIIDDDNNKGYATIYQCADIKDFCWSQGAYNSFGPGIEVSYRPEAWSNSNLYSEEIRNQKHLQSHLVLEDEIHGKKIQVFGPSQAQINSLTALLWGLCELFPKIEPEFPKENGKIIKAKITPAQLTGLTCHYHLTKDKIDPVGINLDLLEREVQLRLKTGY